MRTGKKIAKFIITAIILLMGLFATPMLQVWAGEINSEESRVISVAAGTFTYNGKTYAAYSSYVRQLFSYLCRDDINLSAEDADRAINYIFSNVEEGLRRGYIYEIKPKETETSAEEPTEEPGSETEQTSSENSSSEEPPSESGSSEKKPGETTERATEPATEKPAGTSEQPRTEQGSESQNPSGSTEEPTTETNLDELFGKIEQEAIDEHELEKRVDQKNADASAMINEDTIIIDNGDGEPIELDPEKEIIPSSWTTALIITGIVTCCIAVITCLILILTKCMRFRKTDRKKPLPGHRRRHKIRKMCRNVLLVTTGVSIAGIFLLIALFAALFNQGRIEKNIQESGYFRYAYIEYLSEHGRALEGQEFLSDEEADIVSGTVSSTSKDSNDAILSYDEFLVREKQATQALLSGKKDVEYQHSNVAPYILRIQEDIKMPMILSGGFFLLALILGVIFTIFMDLRRDRGIKMLAISELIGTAFAILLTAWLFFLSPAKKLFIEPDFLYLFFKNYLDWIMRVFAVISVFGLVLGMALIGLYMSRRKERSRK